MQYDKPAIDIARQISQLEARGMIISDKELARHFLSQVSYYRLAGYWWPMQADKQQHTFKPGSTFEMVIERYNFDRELRLIVFNMIERIEIAIRTQLIYELSIANDPWWFEDVQLFRNNRLWKKHLDSIKKEVSRSKEVFIEEHLKKYHADNRCPPSWKSLEVVSFGLLSKLFNNLSNSLPEKDQIVRNLAVGNHTFLSSWLQSITVIRNICAHHSRLWNRRLPTPPKLPKRLPKPWIDINNVNRHKFYAILCCMQYLLQTISPGNRFRQRLEDLFDTYPNVDPAAMGFPAEWSTAPIWKNSLDS